MTQTIKIKRSTGSAAPSNLAQGELAYSKGSDTLYVGDPSTANTPIAVGGAIKNNAGSPVLATGVTAAEIRTLIGVDASGTNNSTDVTLNAALTDVFSISGQELSAVDGTADRLVFWDDSASKLTYMTPSALKDFASLNTTDNVTFNNLTVSGNLTITGDIDSYNVTDLDVTDKTITVNAGGTEAGSDGSGLIVHRGTATAASIKWDETDGKFNFTDGIQVATQTVISDAGRFYASDGTDTKAAYGFDNSSTTGLSYESSGNRIKFVSGGAVRAYIQTGGTNPITNTFYVDGRSEFTGQIAVTGDGNSGNWKAAYDYRNVGHVPLAGGTMTGDLNLGDSNKVQLGASQDLALYHDGSNSYIEDVGTGNLIVRSNGTSLNLQNNADEDFISCNVTNNEVIIYHNNDKVLETETTGITVTHTDGSTGTITGNLSGNASTATALATSRNFSITGDITANAVGFDGSGAVALSASLDNGVVSFAKIANAAVLLSTETFSDVDNQLMTAAAINDRITSFGYGTISSIEIDSTDNSISGTGTGTTGALTFDLEVATIDGGTY